MTSSTRVPGVFVLGMHRSGTSVMAGVLDRLGLDGGPRESMVMADQFNSDGYWEQQPLVAMHDRLLYRLGGFASAPPARASQPELVRRLPDAPEQINRFVDTMFHRSWFVKDPRHCLLLPLWTEALGSDDLAIVVLRSPDAVVRSLHHRNGYSRPLALGLWERYMIDLLSTLNGRPALVVRYEELIRRPLSVVEQVAEVLTNHTGSPQDQAIAHAADLVRARSPMPLDADPHDTRTIVQLTGVLNSTVGYHKSFRFDGLLPEQSADHRRRLARRRLALKFVEAVAGHDPIARSHLDRRRGTRVRKVADPASQ
jgi:hypothetical protein